MKRRYLDNAEKQRAYRERTADRLAVGDSARFVLSRPTPKLIEKIVAAYIEQYAGPKGDALNAVKGAITSGIANGLSRCRGLVRDGDQMDIERFIGARDQGEIVTIKIVGAARVKKLTEKQRAAIAAVRAEEVYISNPGGSPRINGASPQVIGKLRSLGLIKWPHGGYRDGELCQLTEEGVAAASDIEETTP